MIDNKTVVQFDKASDKNTKVSDVSNREKPNLLSDEELLNIMKEDFYEIRPTGCLDFFKRAKRSPSLPYLRKRFHMSYNEILILAGVPKTELNNHIRMVPIDKQLENLKLISESLGHTPSVSELSKSGYPPNSLIHHYGTFNNALKAAGLSITRDSTSEKQISKNNFLKKYTQYSKQLGKPASKKELKNICENYSYEIVLRLFGGMSGLRRLAGFSQPTSGYKKQYTKEHILNLLTEEYLKYQRRLSNQEISENKKLPAVSTIMSYFETKKMDKVWNEVCQEAIKKAFAQTNNAKHTSYNGAKRAGDIGEHNVAHQLAFLKKEKFLVYNNVSLKSEKYPYPQEFDHIVVGPTGISALETKSYSGEIIIERNGQWSQSKNGVLKEIENPSDQVQRHQQVLKDILNDMYKVNSIIVIGNPKTRVCGEDNCHFMIKKVGNILDFILCAKSDKPLSDYEVKSIGKTIEDHIVNSKVA